MFIKAASNGKYVTSVEGGPSPEVTTQVSDVPAAIDLTNTAWNLDVEDWKPQAPYGTTGIAGSQTTKPVVSVALDALKPWDQVPAIAEASGVGTYTTTLTLPASWTASTHGADLDLGQVTDSFRVSVNGPTSPPTRSPASSTSARTCTPGRTPWSCGSPPR